MRRTPVLSGLPPAVLPRLREPDLRRRLDREPWVDRRRLTGRLVRRRDAAPGPGREPPAPATTVEWAHAGPGAPNAASTAADDCCWAALSGAIGRPCPAMPGLTPATIVCAIAFAPMGGGGIGCAIAVGSAAAIGPRGGCGSGCAGGSGLTCIRWGCCAICCASGGCIAG